MPDKQHYALFNAIAPVYGLFYRRQVANFRRVLHRAAGRLDVARYASTLDVGCGTGALCAALHERGLAVTGVEPAVGMLRLAQKNLRGKGIALHEANALHGLPFADGQFDLVFVSYVAHGLQPQDRQRLYREMRRISRHAVIIHDFNLVRSPVITMLERMEGSDYFRFIHTAADELRDCRHEQAACFARVESFAVGKRANWYVGWADGG
ncbi:MAG: class I SAM-dependent methyltransferase [Clostridiales bacterium]|nr:class I SAM-dependent methyltransferase [Clostridiales bacterium]